MLKALRSSVGSYLAKIMFALLIGSFALWGVGDMVTRFVRPERPVATVGGTEIAGPEVIQSFQRRMAQLRTQFGGRLTTEQAIQFGLLDQTVQEIVAERLYDLESRRVGISIGTDLIRLRIRSEPAFRDITGQFSPVQFEAALRNAGFSEATYVSLLRHDLARELMAGAVVAGLTVPAPLVDQLYRYRFERRVAELMTVTSASIADIPAPSAEDLAKYHQDNAGRFTAPEYRQGYYVSLKPGDLAGEVTVDEAKLREEYDRRQAEFVTPERREISQMLVSDEATARKVADAIKAGGEFAQVAKDVAGLPADGLSLGLVSRGDLLPSLADSVFALPLGGTTEPLQSPLGWHVLKLDRTEPGSTREFAEVRETLRRDVAIEQASELAYKLSTKLEDEIAGGVSPRDAAAKLALKIVELPQIDRQGVDPAGKVVDAVKADKTLLDAFFQTSEGANSRLTETPDGGYVMAHVDRVTQPALRPLETVRSEVEAAWRAARQAEAATAKAQALAGRLKAGEDFAKVAQDAGMSITTTTPVTRSAGPRADAPPAQVVARMFQLKPGEIGDTATPEGHVVLRVTEIQPADPAQAKDEVAALSDQLKRTISQETLEAYGAALRQRYPVSIDRDVMQRLF
ncbi:MAG: peptidyl-prolyl cis-trans isomerase [Proteobacteria bacterium]|nr:peptidyl-prolyl cis-trans isomerase [Pseudomonadota bacterium]MBI3496042.1 peptidyl-prolyl cis-trans isomerase [Pseudomonadota bacterium]